MFRHVSLMVLGAVVGLCVPIYDSAGQATPEAPPGVTARTTALLVSAIRDPLHVTGSDGLVHLEYDLVVTNVFSAPVSLEDIEVLTPEGASLLRLSGDALTAVTQPLVGSTKPASSIPAYETVGVIVDVGVPPDQVPERLTHHITYALAPDAPAANIIGSLESNGPGLTIDPFQPVVIASPLRGDGWLNANGCCDASPHRVARLAVDGNHLVKPETFAIDWLRVQDGRLFASDGTEPADWYGFGAELLAVADGTVVFVRDGMPEETPYKPVTAVHQPLDYSGNQVVLEIAPGVYAIYAHVQPGSIQVQAGQPVTTGQVLGLLGNTGNSIAPHLHFQLSDGPDLLTANSLPFVIDQWTLTGTAELDMSSPEVPIAGTPTQQRETLPLDLAVSDFP
jgi:hypothetical protein